MRQIFGYVLVKETNAGVPTLVVTAYDSGSALDGIHNRAPTAEVLNKLGKRILAVKAGQITRFDTQGQVAAIVVHAPNVKGLDMKAVYALKAGTNQIAAKVEAWDVPMLVPGGVSYDIALEQSAGLTRIRSGITPGRGELVDIR